MSYTPGTRQFQGDFAEGKLSEVALIRRPDAISFPYTTSFCVGPRAVGDVSLGVLNRAWRVRADNSNNVWLSRANDYNTAWEAETLLFNYAGAPILELDCSFEQAGRPVVVAERTSASGLPEVWLYWFKPVAGTFVFEKIADGRTPRCVLDNPKVTSDSDILLFYLSDSVDKLVYRQQRDAYAIEIATTKIGVNGLFVEDVFRTDDYRVAVVMSRRSISGVYTLERLESTLYPAPLSGIDEYSVQSLIVSGELRIIVIILTLFDVDEFKVNAVIQSGTLIVMFTPVQTLYDIDEFKVSAAIQSGTLLTLLILHTLFDVDEFKVSAAIQSGTLVVVVILHTLFDVDEFKVSAAIQSGTLA